MTDTTHIRHMEDLDFTIMAQVRDHRVDFCVYDIAGRVEGEVKGVFDVPEWTKAGADVILDTTSDISEAACYLHGHVKWDGCSNWHFDEQDNCMLHACERSGLQRLGEVMARCWDWTAELLPNWSV